MEEINLYSDTQTLPSDAMRAAISAAILGDEQFGHDPTVNELCERSAALMGKEQAMFLPSGTMANLIATLAHCERGDEVIADAQSHFINLEGGGASAIAGVQPCALDGARGVFTADQLTDAVRSKNRYQPRSRMVVIEQTNNLRGGTVWSKPAIDSVTEAARAHGLRVHMDGARIFNAAIACGTSAMDFAIGADSVYFDLSKGLGCPAGAILASDAAFVSQAWTWKQRLGGAMRQAGILAAAGLYALDHNTTDLQRDHANARKIAEILNQSGFLRVDPRSIETNIVIAEVVEPKASVDWIAQALLNEGIRVSKFSGGRIRLVTHRDFCSDALERVEHAFGTLHEHFERAFGTKAASMPLLS